MTEKLIIVHLFIDCNSKLTSCNLLNLLKIVLICLQQNTLYYETVEYSAEYLKIKYSVVLKSYVVFK